MAFVCSHNLTSHFSVCIDSSCSVISRTEGTIVSAALPKPTVERRPLGESSEPDSSSLDGVQGKLFASPPSCKLTVDGD